MVQNRQILPKGKIQKYSMSKLKLYLTKASLIKYTHSLLCKYVQIQIPSLCMTLHILCK